MIRTCNTDITRHIVKYHSLARVWCYFCEFYFNYLDYL